MLRTVLISAVAASAIALPAYAQIDANAAVSVQDQLRIDQSVKDVVEVVEDGLRPDEAPAAPTAAEADVNLRIEPKVGMTLRTTDAQTLGRVTDLVLDEDGQVESLIVQAGEDMLRRVPVAGLTFHGNAATTTRTQSEFAALPAFEAPAPAP